MSALAPERETPGRALSAEDLALTHPLVEQAIGRPLRSAERIVDVIRLNNALEQAKEQLAVAIKAEQKRAVNSWLRYDKRLRLQVTLAMLRPLETLFALGQEEALAELERLGLTPERAYEHAPLRKGKGRHALSGLHDKLKSGLVGLTLRVEGELVHLDLTEAASSAIARALIAAPGGRDLASRVVSTALDAGFGATFEANAGLVDGWEISSVLDQNTCQPCAEHDGEQFSSWAEATLLLPDGGPAVYCDGGTRCRCRLVPLVAA